MCSKFRIGMSYLLKWIKLRTRAWDKTNLVARLIIRKVNNRHMNTAEFLYGRDNKNCT